MRNQECGGISNRIQFNLETVCLHELNKNFECICGMNKHFPILIRDNSKTKTIEMSHCGKCLNRLYKIDIPNYENQIDCIIHNLKKCKIKHFDIAERNICILNKKIICLIDFGIATIDNYPCLKKGEIKFKKLYKTFNNDPEKYYEHLKKSLIKIIESNCKA